MNDDLPPIENHRPVEYQLADHGLKTEGFTVTRSADRSRYDVVGLCPGCGGRVVRQWNLGLPGTKGRKGKRALKPGPRTLTCDCGRVHAERPPEHHDKGCGAFWQVMLS
ncbi:hypothetical protein [Actinomadura luteofluorescens]|uniref:hypothetical protein n=1 Tax=Actinomadura luteofluorescens TaxID=46163 RepID=UPI003D8CCA21